MNVHTQRPSDKQSAPEVLLELDQIFRTYSETENGTMEYLLELFSNSSIKHYSAQIPFIAAKIASNGKLINRTI